jgi:hypothetical protein
VPSDMDIVLEQTQCDFWWQPSDVTVEHRPEISYLHAPRPTRLYNNVVRVRAPSDQHLRLIEEVNEAHGDGPSEWRLATPSLSDQLEAALLGAGYEMREECIATTMAVTASRPPAPAGIEVRHVQTTEGLIDQYKTISRAFNRADQPVSEADLAHHLQLSTGPNARCHRFVAYDTDTDEPLCAAAFNSYPDLGFGFLWGGGTVTQARGRGVYTAIMTARMAHARQLGLTHVGLYALTTTSAPILARQGFDAHGRLRMWTRPSEAM